MLSNSRRKPKSEGEGFSVIHLTDLWNKWFGTGKRADRSGAEKANEPRFKLGEGFYFEFDEASNGMGGYGMINVVLLNLDDPSFKRCIVDGIGRIQNFPGVEKGDWVKNLIFPLSDKTKFRFWISGFREGKATVEWTLQPDGRYFEDEDGFGGEDCDEITLYSSIDTNGMFTEPFRYR